MIASIRGEVIAIEEENVIVDVGGVGYRVFCPLVMMQGQYGMNQEIFLYTHLVVREDQWTLFGFLTQEELTLFCHFIGVSGIGGKSALGILNQLTARQIAGAMGAGDAHPFEKVSGIGKKTAQRIVLELKDKIAKLPIAGAEAPVGDVTAREVGDNDAVAALCQLGYSRTEAKKAVVKVVSDDPAVDNEGILR